MAPRVLGPGTRQREHASGAASILGPEESAPTTGSVLVRMLNKLPGMRLSASLCRLQETTSAAGHFKSFAPFMTVAITMSGAGTRQLLGWKPEHAGLIARLDQGHYFTTD